MLLSSIHLFRFEPNLLMEQKFGGTWTDQKMDIVVSYAHAYLTIMQNQKWAKTLYFDGFAGSGNIKDESTKDTPDINLFEIEKEEKESDVRKGTALRILEMNRSFDLYYFVEKNDNYQKELNQQVKTNFPDKKAHVVKDDCNKKLLDLSRFLKENSNFRALAFIDPYGMSVKWSSIEALKGLGVDLWILVPTGVGANRLLVKDGNIPEGWLCKLEEFLGINREQIKKLFYKQITMGSMFGDDVTIVEKEKDTISKLGKLYSNRLKEIFKFVSEPFVMRNSTNSIMYHFMMATNIPAALKISNDVIKPKYKL